MQYGSVHLCFAGHVSDENMKLISSCKELAPRILTFNEINLDFYFYESNIFTLNFEESIYLFNTSSADYNQSKYLEKIGYKLYTVCSILLEKPYIQYQGNSEYARTVAKSLESHLAKGEYSDKMHNPRANLIIVDRSIDISTPLMHDYTYETVIYDLLETNAKGEFDLQIES